MSLPGQMRPTRELSPNAIVAVNIQLIVVLSAWGLKWTCGRAELSDHLRWTCSMNKK